jgi:hypothetical protein
VGDEMGMTTLQLDRSYYPIQSEMARWCYDNIGMGGWRLPDRERWGDKWGIESIFGQTTFHFLDEKDATLFALRWIK